MGELFPLYLYINYDYCLFFFLSYISPSNRNFYIINMDFIEKNKKTYMEYMDNECS